MKQPETPAPADAPRGGGQAGLGTAALSCEDGPSAGTKETLTLQGYDLYCAHVIPSASSEVKQREKPWWVSGVQEEPVSVGVGSCTGLG